jgi:hypothetical protein
MPMARSKKRRWLQLDRDNAWQGPLRMFRFNSPTEAYFDESWQIPDVEKAR